MKRILRIRYLSRLSEGGIYKRKQESKKTRTLPRKRSRKQELDQESDQETRKQERKQELDQESDQEKKEKTFFFS